MTFRLRSKAILLTYAQVNDDSAASFLSSPTNHFEFVAGAFGTPLVYRMGRESHADGGTHFHVFILWSSPITCRNQRAFDYHEAHPNIESIRRTPEKAFDYAGKDGDIIHEHGERPGKSGTVPSGRDCVWAEALSRETKVEFLSHLREQAPRDYVLYFDAIERFADRHFAPPTPEYRSPPIEIHGFRGMDEWVEQSRIGRDDRRGRVKSLILWGPSLTGKTLWSRTLGR